MAPATATGQRRGWTLAAEWVAAAAAATGVIAAALAPSKRRLAASSAATAPEPAVRQLQ
jgi:hypothetical protein